LGYIILKNQLKTQEFTSNRLIIGDSHFDPSCICGQPVLGCILQGLRLDKGQRNLTLGVDLEEGHLDEVMFESGAMQAEVMELLLSQYCELELWLHRKLRSSASISRLAAREREPKLRLQRIGLLQGALSALHSNSIALGGASARAAAF
jgi:hypothetical protein